MTSQSQKNYILNEIDFTKERYLNRWNEEKLEQEMEEHPLFMTKNPDNDKLPSVVEALQKLKYDDDYNSKDELAIHYKEDGNFNFNLKKYHLAINCYTKAIDQKSESKDLNSIFYSNRSLTNYHLKNFRSSLLDALKAIEFNKENKKAIRLAISCYEKLKKYKDLINFCLIHSEKIDNCDYILTKTKYFLNIIERDKRKKKFKETKQKSEIIEYMKMVFHEFSKRKIITIGDIFKVDSDTYPDCKIQLDNKCLFFPVLLKYPQVNKFDYIKKVNENCFISDLLSMLLEDNSNKREWDLEEKFTSKTVKVKYNNPLNNNEISIDITKRLIDLLQNKVCIKPFEFDENVGIHKKEKVEITLGDCLACSGCITSAEKVLIEQNNEIHLIKVLNENKVNTENKKIFVVSLSLQAISSLAVNYELNFQETAEKLVTYFKSIGINYVFEISFARHLALYEILKEFKKNYFKSKNENLKNPILCSICPGFVCYVEKTHGEMIIPYLSKVKSPQQIFGSLLKHFWVKNQNIESSRIYHVSFMPCFDKKLEASRKEFIVNDFPDVDIVLTPKELENMLINDNIEFKNLKKTNLDNFLDKTNFLLSSEFNSSKIKSHLGSGSGGYAENIYRLMSWILLNENISNKNELEFKCKRNKDFLELHLNSPKGDHLLSVAIVNGFRNIQTIIQRIKRKNLDYDYVEVMACPSGCLNGGGMLKDVALEILQNIYSNLDKHNFNLNFLDSDFSDIYEHWFNNNEKIKFYLHTTFNYIPKFKNPININW